METQQGRPKLAQALSGLVAQFSCAERWASSNTRGRAGDRGNRHVTTALATSWRNLLPHRAIRQNSVSCRAGAKKPERKLENNEAMDVTLLLGHKSGWEPKSLLHWSQSLKLIDKKTRPSSHDDLSHAAPRVVYLYSSCWTVSFSLSVRDITKLRGGERGVWSGLLSLWLSTADSS